MIKPQVGKRGQNPFDCFLKILPSGLDPPRLQALQDLHLQRLALHSSLLLATLTFAHSLLFSVFVSVVVLHIFSHWPSHVSSLPHIGSELSHLKIPNSLSSNLSSFNSVQLSLPCWRIRCVGKTLKQIPGIWLNFGPFSDPPRKCLRGQGKEQIWRRCPSFSL